jgi:membrane protein YdbS with pleckstrin-like domain
MEEIEHPDVKVLFVWRASVLIGWGILAAIALGCAILAITTAEAPTWIAAFAAIPLLIAVIEISLLRLRWQNWTFKLTPHTLEMSHGWLVKHRRVVSRNRIQHVDFSSGPVGRKFDLVHVVVHTAGTAVGTIPGVRSERAERLRVEFMSGPKSL